MRKTAVLAFLSLTLSQAHAGAVSHTFTQPCEVVRPAALDYLREIGVALKQGADCDQCFDGTALRIDDERGRRVYNNRKAIEKYTTTDLKYEKIGPVVQIVHPGLQATASLRLSLVENACRAELRLDFSWYGMELVLGFPVDGDPIHGDSNGKLEAAYLLTLQQRIDRSATTKR